MAPARTCRNCDARERTYREREETHIGNVYERERETLFLCVTHLYRSLPLVVKGSDDVQCLQIYVLSAYFQCIYSSVNSNLVSCKYCKYIFLTLKKLFFSF